MQYANQQSLSMIRCSTILIRKSDLCDVWSTAAFENCFTIILSMGKGERLGG